jgi:peptidoglycan/LPS O-acetylase OafA/YrhL
MLQFRRITAQNRFIAQIDGLRFVAIAWVVFFHVYAALSTRSAIPVPWPLDVDLPKRGVELFFAISGFILGVPFASVRLRNAPTVNLKQYFLRRLTRLEPPYFISLFVWAASQWVTAHRPLGDMAPHLLASFFYLHNLIFGGFDGAVNSVAWSLEVEIQFYVLVPLLAGLFAIAGAHLRRIVIAALMLASGIFGLPLSRSVHFHYSIAYYLAFFLAGFLVCDFYVTRQGEWKPTFLWDALALCLWPLVWYLGRNAGHVVLPFVIVALYLAAFRGRICSAIFGNRVITNIGGMCYSIYLFHFLVVYFVKHMTMLLHIGGNFWFYYALQAGMIVPVVLLLCGAFFVLIERPCMDKEWPQKLWRFAKTLRESNVRRQRQQGNPAEGAMHSEPGKPLSPEAERLRADQ